MTDPAADLLRENTGTTGLVQTARAAAEILAHFDIPHLIVGGFAVQEHGYPRLTIGVDIVVPDSSGGGRVSHCRLVGSVRARPELRGSRGRPAQSSER